MQARGEGREYQRDHPKIEVRRMILFRHRVFVINVAILYIGSVNYYLSRLLINIDDKTHN